MNKTMLGILLGAVVYFGVGAAAWMLMPWNAAVMKKLPEETLIRDTLNVVVQEPGVYFFPSDKTQNGRMECSQYKDLYKKGPAGLLFYTPAGSEPMGPINFVLSFVEALVAAGFSMWLLILARGRVASYGPRVMTVLMLGIFVWFNSHIPYWNWMLFPTNYVLTVLLNTCLCFGSLGLVLARFVPDGN